MPWTFQIKQLWRSFRRPQVHSCSNKHNSGSRWVISRFSLNCHKTTNTGTALTPFIDPRQTSPGFEANGSPGSPPRLFSKNGLALKWVFQLFAWKKRITCLCKWTTVQEWKLRVFHFPVYPTPSKKFVWIKIKSFYFLTLLSAVVVQVEPDPFSMQSNTQVTKNCTYDWYEGRINSRTFW